MLSSKFGSFTFDLRRKQKNERSNNNQQQQHQNWSLRKQRKQLKDENKNLRPSWSQGEFYKNCVDKQTCQFPMPKMGTTILTATTTMGIKNANGKEGG